MRGNAQPDSRPTLYKRRQTIVKMWKNFHNRGNSGRSGKCEWQLPNWLPRNLEQEFRI